MKQLSKTVRVTCAGVGKRECGQGRDGAKRTALIPRGEKIDLDADGQRWRCPVCDDREVMRRNGRLADGLEP